MAISQPFWHRFQVRWEQDHSVLIFDLEAEVIEDCTLHDQDPPKILQDMIIFNDIWVLLYTIIMYMTQESYSTQS